MFAALLTFGIIVNGTSMQPALQHGDSLIAESYQGPVYERELRRGDIVVYERGFNGKGLDLEIKRIIGVAGDSVCVDLAPVRGKHLVDGRIPEGQYYMRGDGGGWSSRHFGLIPRSWIRGVIVRRHNERK